MKKTLERSLKAYSLEEKLSKWNVCKPIERWKIQKLPYVYNLQILLLILAA